MKWNFYSLFLVVAMLFACNSTCFSATKIVYGFENAKHFKKQGNSKVYIQAGSFLNKKSALHLQKKIEANTGYPVKVTHHGRYSIVTVGPIRKASVVRRLGATMTYTTSTHKAYAYKAPPVIAPVAPSPPVIKPEMPEAVHPNANWFVTLGGSMQYPQFNSSMSVHNGANFPPPYNMDTYTTTQNHQPMASLAFGRRWERDTRWLPAYSFSVMYEYLLPTNIGNTITQYSSPDFTNYNYTWNFSANILMAAAKVNLFKYGRFSPYLNGGLGCSFNRTSNYSENALPDVTARISAGYASQSNAQFAYNAGAGVDVQLDKQIILSAGYQYLSLGSVASGQGAGPWIGQYLNLGKYRANTVFVGVSYLIGE